jgi:predicted phage terminase large subunit-like protein
MVRFPPIKRVWTQADVDLKAEEMIAMAREDFLAFRHQVHQNMIDTWWQRDVAKHLMIFWRDLQAGRRPALILQAPPQHGKTEQVTDFVAWCAGQDPNLRTIFGSYSDELGMKVNLSLQRLFDGPHYRVVFPKTKISDTFATNTVSGGSGRWMRNSSLLEYVWTRGSFRNTTVMGQINGMGLDLGVIDDPIKGRAEAASKTIRDKTWSWFTDDFFGRFSNDAGFLMIMTRWHLDDPAGRWLEHFPNTKVLRYPAIAERDEKHRAKGEALFPEMKPLEFLAQRRKVLTEAGWQSVYQQSPIAAGGDMFPTDRVGIIRSVDRSEVKRSIRYVDKADTEDGGAYTAAVLMHEMKDGTTVVEDVIRGQWLSLERDKRIMQAARADATTCRRYQLWFEQEPGSGGKESAEASARKFKEFAVFLDKVTGAKEVRAEPYAAQVQSGNVRLVAAEWNRAFLEEHEQFPLGKYKDQVDASAGAYNKLLAAVGSYDRTMDWVG